MPGTRCNIFSLYWSGCPSMYQTTGLLTFQWCCRTLNVFSYSLDYMCFTMASSVFSIVFLFGPNNKMLSILWTNVMFYKICKWSCFLWTVLWKSKLSDCIEGGRVSTALGQDHKWTLLSIPYKCKLHLVFLLHKARKKTICQISVYIPHTWGHIHL